MQVYDVRIELIKALNTMVSEIVDQNPVLESLSVGRLSVDQYRSFAVLRYQSALSFEILLRRGISSSESAQFGVITAALKQNLLDEIGADASGKINPDKSHSKWRMDFYRALGITDDSLEAQISGKAAKAYLGSIERVMDSNDSFAIVGAILALERFFPVEFTAMQRNRDQVFPNLMPEARLYLDDHIVHDASAHFPDLLEAVVPAITSQDDFSRLLIGLEAVRIGKQEFYQQIALDFSLRK